MRGKRGLGGLKFVTQLYIDIPKDFLPSFPHTSPSYSEAGNLQKRTHPGGLVLEGHRERHPQSLPPPRGPICSLREELNPQPRISHYLTFSL